MDLREKVARYFSGDDVTYDRANSTVRSMLCAKADAILALFEQERLALEYEKKQLEQDVDIEIRRSDAAESRCAKLEKALELARPFVRFDDGGFERANQSVAREIDAALAAAKA